jgi:hypothetical protein
MHQEIKESLQTEILAEPLQNENGLDKWVTLTF